MFSYCLSKEDSDRRVADKNSCKSIGYIRAKVKGQNILTKAIIDSGNFYDDLISEELAKKLKLEVYGRTSVAGTASRTGNVQILGKVKPFLVYLEGIKMPALVQPQVVKDLAHPLNLGERFLCRKIPSRSNLLDVT